MSISGVTGSAHVAITAATESLKTPHAPQQVAVGQGERENDGDADDRVQNVQPGKGESVDVNA